MGISDTSCDCDAIHEDAVRYVREKSPSSDMLMEITGLYKVFGDGTRLKIMSALNCHELCVCDLAVLIGMSKSAVSHQLRVLRGHNLVKSYKDGKHVIYSLADDHVKELLDVAIEHIEETFEEE